MTHRNMLGRATILTATVVLVSPLTASAASLRTRGVQPPAAAQLVVTAGLPAGGSEAEVAEVMATGAIFYRFIIELVARDGRAFSDAGGWDATIFIGGIATRAALVRLGTGQHEVVLPRPLGFTASAGDSLGVRVTLRSAASDSVHLRLVAEYEPLRPRFSRFPAVAAPAVPEDPDHRPARSVSWLWETPVSGWLLALCGMHHSGIGELLLQDVESGALIWRHTFEQPVSGAVGPATGVVLAGATVEAGRSYRLVATFTDDVSAAPAMLLQAMVLPTPSIALRGNGN